MKKIGDVVKFNNRKFKVIPYTRCNECSLHSDDQIECTEHEAFDCSNEDSDVIMFKEIKNFEYGK